MTMLVAGAAGFIGSHLTDRLLDAGHRVLGVDNLIRGTEANIAAAGRNPRFQLLRLNLASSDEIDGKLIPVCAGLGDGIDTVWHLAANSDIAAGVADPRIDLHDTFMTTFNLLEFMRAAGCRKMAFASTSAVYGERVDPLTEEVGPLFPTSQYGAMKLASEAIISAACESHLERASICRFPNVVGGRGTHGVIFDLLNKLANNRKELEVLGDGKQRKPYLHVSELVDAMIFIWSRATEKRALYNIGPEDDGVEVSAIAQSVIEEVGCAARVRYTGGDRGWVGDVPRFSYSVEKLAKLGWRPTSTSAAAVRKSIAELATERGFGCRRS
jgi:UDP-glucose 4-epimerase